ncbi:MAG: hypothetical protein LIR50_14435 [Bacillota bacterium]|nr:hypothetical protein [Bacillota bacterium]
MQSNGIFIFHDHSDTVNDGEIFINPNTEEITIDITGTAQSFEVIFEGKVNNDSEWSPIMFGNLNDLSLDTKATKLNTQWQNEISGYGYFRVKITNISGGYLTIKGRLKY